MGSLWSFSVPMLHAVRTKKDTAAQMVRAVSGVDLATRTTNFQEDVLLRIAEMAGPEEKILPVIIESERIRIPSIFQQAARDIATILTVAQSDQQIRQVLVEILEMYERLPDRIPAMNASAADVVRKQSSAASSRLIKMGAGDGNEALTKAMSIHDAFICAINPKAFPSQNWFAATWNASTTNKVAMVTVSAAVIAGIAYAIYQYRQGKKAKPVASVAQAATGGEDAPVVPPSAAAVAQPVPALVPFAPITAVVEAPVGAAEPTVNVLPIPPAPVAAPPVALSAQAAGVGLLGLPATPPQLARTSGQPGGGEPKRAEPPKQVDRKLIGKYLRGNTVKSPGFRLGRLSDNARCFRDLRGAANTLCVRPSDAAAINTFNAAFDSITTGGKHNERGKADNIKLHMQQQFNVQF